MKRWLVKTLLHDLAYAVLVALAWAVLAAVMTFVINHSQLAIPGISGRQSLLDTAKLVALTTFIPALTGRLIFGRCTASFRWGLAVLFGGMSYYLGIYISDGNVEYGLYTVALTAPMGIVLATHVGAPIMLRIWNRRFDPEDRETQR